MQMSLSTKMSICQLEKLKCVCVLVCVHEEQLHSTTRGQSLHRDVALVNMSLLSTIYCTLVHGSESSNYSVCISHSCPIRAASMPASM